MYTKQLNNRLTIRFSDEVNEYILKACEIYGVSPSEYVRQVLNQSMWGFYKAMGIVNDRVETLKTEVDCNDNKTDFNDKL